MISTAKAAFTASKAYLAPYATYIKWVLRAAIIGIAFVSGCNYGKNDQKADVVRLSGQVQAYQNENKRFKELAEEAQRDAAKQVADAAKKKKAADAAGERAAINSKKTENKIASRQVQLDKAVADPKCKDLLEFEVCKVVPLP